MLKDFEYMCEHSEAPPYCCDSVGPTTFTFQQLRTQAKGRRTSKPIDFPSKQAISNSSLTSGSLQQSHVIVKSQKHHECVILKHIESFKMSDLIKATNQEVYKGLPIGPPDQNEVISACQHNSCPPGGKLSLHIYQSGSLWISSTCG